MYGSYEASRLAVPASHGYIRLHPSNAATLFAPVGSHRAAHRNEVHSGERKGSSAHEALPR